MGDPTLIEHYCKINRKKNSCPKHRPCAMPECEGCQYYKRIIIGDKRYDPFWKPKKRSLEERITDLELRLNELERKVNS